ncbi:MAG: FAD-binding oxidoreductase [Mariprofundaceae bacterium]
MPVITFEGKDYDCESHETILESLTRHGVLIPSGCRSGVCQTCLTKAVKGQPSPESQKGLKDTLIAQNYFLACVCQPTENMELSVASAADETLVVTVSESDMLNESVLRLRLKLDIPLDYIAGQFINVQHPDTGVTRSYSLASLPCEDFLELHIKRVPDGLLSGYLHDEVRVGDNLPVFGAAGDCFYTARDLDQPLLLVGVGTGLAPLYGILRDALAQGHRGEIHILHGSLAAAGLYYIDELNALSAAHKHVHYVPCVLHGELPKNGLKGDLPQQVQQSFADLKGWRVYVCGDPGIVKTLKQTCFMSGANMTDIYSDPFVFESAA